MEEAEFKITGRCLCESTFFLPLVPQAGYPEQPCSHDWPGCNLRKVWHQSLLQHAASGETQLWEQAPSFATQKRGSGPSQSPTDPVHGGKGRGTSGDKSLYVLQTAAATAAH